MSNSHSIHFVSGSIPGAAVCRSPDGGCLPCSGVSRRVVSISPSSSRGDFKFIYDLQFMHLRCVSKYTSFVCNASYSNNRKNQDFSRQNRFVRNRNRHNDEKEGYEELEESETLSSRNGSLLSATASASGNQKFQSSLAPGPREKEIVELFRKVQAQLRGRAVMKEEKKADESQDRSKESETVDSLLKLLRKHSVQQGKKNTLAVNKRDFVLDQQEEIDRSNKERGGTTVSGELNMGIKDDMQESPKPQLSRPKSNFRKKSPVPDVKLQPDYYSKGSDTNMLKSDLGSRGKLIDFEAEAEVEAEEDDDIPDVESDLNPLFPEGNTFDELSEDESCDIYEEEQNMVEGSDLSGLKLTELRAMAKSRGMKGFSKLKKSELIELLS